MFLHDVDVTEKVSEKVLLKEGWSRIKRSMVVKKYIKKYRNILLKNVCLDIRVLQGDEVLEFVGVFVDEKEKCCFFKM